MMVMVIQNKGWSPLPLHRIVGCGEVMDDVMRCHLDNSRDRSILIDWPLTLSARRLHPRDTYRKGLNTTRIRSRRRMSLEEATNPTDGVFHHSLGGDDSQNDSTASFCVRRIDIHG